MAKNKPHRPRALVRQQAEIRQGTEAARVAQRTGDSFTNFQARVGFGAGSQQDGARFQPDFISRNPYNLESAYRSNWVSGQVVDLVAEDMTREGIDFQSSTLKPDEQQILHDEFERLAIWPKLLDTVKWSRLYGGAIAVLLIDGQNLATPLLPDRIGRDQFKGLAVLDRWNVTPSLHDLVDDLGPDLGKPKFYDVATSAPFLVGQHIHYSRVIRIDGLDLPWRQRQAENGWGQSVLERLYDRIVAFDSTTAGAAQLVYKAHLRTLKLPDLRQNIAMGGPPMEGVLKMLDMIRQFQSIEGLTVIDGQDTFETHSYSFTGLPEVLLQFGQQLSGATQIPLVRLFGQSPAGLNSTGESDLRTYYDGVKTKQDQKLRPGMRVLLDIIHRSRFGKPLPDGFEFSFVSLWQMTDEEKANVAKTTTDAIVAAENSGLISPQIAAKELKQMSRGTGLFTHIDDDYIDQLDTEPPAPGDVDPEPGQPGESAPANEDADAE